MTDTQTDRTRAQQLAADVADLFSDTAERCRELIDLEPDGRALLDLLKDAMGDKIDGFNDTMMALFGKLAVAKGYDPQMFAKPRPPSVPPADAADDYELQADDAGTERMRATLDRLFAEAPKLELANGEIDPTQAPAVECHVHVRGIPTDLYGVMSIGPEGTLRMLTKATIKDPKTRSEREIMCESFFDVSDVTCVMVERPVTGETSSIIHPA